MNIVITDGYTLNPGDLNWEPFKKFGELFYYDRTSVAEVTDRCRDADVILTNKTPIDAHTIAAASHLKLIAVTATGYNMVDIAAAQTAGAAVCNVPAYGTDSVAQHAIALLLECSNKVGIHAQSVREGEWARSADFSFAKGPIIELRGKTLGIVGMGRIGQQTAVIARALGMNILFNNRSRRPVEAGYQQVALDELFAASDFITLHCPLTADNTGFVNAAMLKKMKPSAYLINTSRGALVNEQNLADALRAGVLAGAALDVLSVEPPPAGHPLTALENAIVTPHIAWISFEARQRIMQVTLANLAGYLRGAPQNVVNG